MTKLQFWILSVTSAILVALLLAHLFLARSNNKLGAQLNAQRTYIAQARQIEPVLDQLAKRIAKGTEADPRLQALLAKHGVNVTLPPEAKK